MEFARFHVVLSAEEFHRLGVAEAVRLERLARALDLFDARTKGTDDAVRSEGAGDARNALPRTREIEEGGIHTVFQRRRESLRLDVAVGDGAVLRESVVHDLRAGGLRAEAVELEGVDVTVGRDGADEGVRERGGARA